MHQLSKLVNFFHFDVCLEKVNAIPSCNARGKWNSGGDKFTTHTNKINMCQGGEENSL